MVMLIILSIFDVDKHGCSVFSLVTQGERWLTGSNVYLMSGGERREFHSAAVLKWQV